MMEKSCLGWAVKGRAKQGKARCTVLISVPFVPFFLSSPQIFFLDSAESGVWNQGGCLVCYLLGS